MTRELLLKDTEYDPKDAEEFVSLLRQLRHNRPLTALQYRKKDFRHLDRLKILLP
jgi:hypothetical protein